MEVKSIQLSRLQNMEHFQFAGHVLAICREANIAKITQILFPLQKAFEDEDKALNLPRQEEGTKELEVLDRIRDQAYRSLQILTDLHRHSDDAALRTSAESISEVLGRYPKMLHVNYDKESGMLKNLITDLRAKAMTFHVTKLLAKPYIDRLDKANNAFDQRYRSRLKSAIPSGTFDIKALRAATDKAINAVVRRMDSLDDLEPNTSGLAELITLYNALVDKKRNTLSHRAATSQTARDKRTAGYEALLKPGFASLEQFLKLSSGVLSFTGKTEGTGKNRHYELEVKDKTAENSKPKTIWVGINKDGTLYIWDKESGKPATPTGTEKSSSKNT